MSHENLLILHFSSSPSQQSLCPSQIHESRIQAVVWLHLTSLLMSVPSRSAKCEQFVVSLQPISSDASGQSCNQKKVIESTWRPEVHKTYIFKKVILFFGWQPSQSIISEQSTTISGVTDTLFGFWAHLVFHGLQPSTGWSPIYVVTPTVAA